MFSRTIKMSISSYRLSTPLYDFIGLRFAYVFNSFLRFIIGLGWPGVLVIAPKSTASLFLAFFRVSSGSVVPFF